MFGKDYKPDMVSPAEYQVCGGETFPLAYSLWSYLRLGP